MSADGRLVSPAQPLNLARRFLHRHVTEGRGDRTALLVDRLDGPVERLTYADVAAASARYGHALSAAGVGIEDRVIILLEDGLPWVASFFGTLGIGATTIFLNQKISAEEIAFYLADSRAKAVITTAEVAKKLPEARQHVRSVLIVDDPSTVAAIDAHPAAPVIAETTGDDFAIWLYSSGSTGAPKAAVHRAQDFVFNVERYAAGVLNMQPDDVTVSVPKLFFGYATGANLLFPFEVGAAAVLFADKPTPARLFDLITRHRATVLVNVPTMIAQMAEAHDAGGHHWNSESLRVVTSAGEALPPELYTRWKASIGAEILDGIGSAEMFHVFISNRFGDTRAGSLGKLVEGYQARIVDDDGNDCPDGEVGTLWAGGDSAAAFYWQRAERSRQVLRGGWVVTGDKFRRDADGYFYYCGRASDVVKVAGRWVSPQEIEDALTRHEAVAEAAVAFYSDAGLTKPMAFVIPRDGYEATEALGSALSDHVAAATMPFKAPRFVELVTELPRGDRDKLDRGTLGEMAQAAADRRGAG